jgi:hypothetical protein
MLYYNKVEYIRLKKRKLLFIKRALVRNILHLLKSFSL